MLGFENASATASQAQRVRGPDENGELECGGSSERVRRMKRAGTQQETTEPPGQSRGLERVPRDQP